MSKREKKRISLKWGLLGIVALCWMLPIMLTLLAAGRQLSHTFNQNVQETLEVNVRHAMTLSEQKLRAIAASSRELSYEDTVSAAYRKYLDSGSEVQLYQLLTPYLFRKFSTSVNVKSAFLVMLDDPYRGSEEVACKMYYAVVPGQTGTASDTRRYFLRMQQDLVEGAAELGTGIGIKKVDDELFVVRNLVTPEFRPYSALVLQCDERAVFSSIYDLPDLQSACIRIGGEEFSWQSDEPRAGRLLYAEYETSLNGIPFAVQVEMRTLDFWQAMPSLRVSLGLLLLLLVPLLALIIWAFYRYISNPLAALIEASRRVGAGERGYCVQELPETLELCELAKQFNNMSIELKEQFERSYMEQAAAQDARIKALQSQINPHFLNNTLEIINWEARIAGNEKVSHMIEALSVMSSAAMARDGRERITLREELEYSEAYLYIIHERFGDSLKVEKRVDDEVLNASVPRLILQPLVENAIEHGVANQRENTVTLTVKRSGQQLELTVSHMGTMTETDRENVRRLLADPQPGHPQVRGHIGIRNVNRRLKLLYGPDYGLSIGEEGPLVVSRIVMPYEEMQ